MSLFWKREKEVRTLIGQYFAAVDGCLDAFDRAMRIYLEEGPSASFREHDRLTHRWESRADDLRWETELKLYGRAILPESRDDILTVFEIFDGIPNLAETVTYRLATQDLRFPAPMLERLGPLVAINLEAYRVLRRALDALLSDPAAVSAEVERVDEKESASDALEYELIVEIFRQDLPGDLKLQLREIVKGIGDLSDTCERLARRVEIIALKKRI